MVAIGFARVSLSISTQLTAAASEIIQQGKTEGQKERTATEGTRACMDRKRTCP